MDGRETEGKTRQKECPFVNLFGLVLNLVRHQNS